jgi:predicted RNA-binding protein with RPS1 domain
MEQFLGQKFKGMISGVTDWGIYVEVQENKCEGMVSVRDIKDDYYRLEEQNFRFVGQRNGKIYALGDVVWIEVRKADVLKRRLDFIFTNPPSNNDKTSKESYDDFSNMPVEKSLHSRDGNFSDTNRRADTKFERKNHGKHKGRKRR